MTDAKFPSTNIGSPEIAKTGPERGKRIRRILGGGMMAGATAAAGYLTLMNPALGAAVGLAGGGLISLAGGIIGATIARIPSAANAVFRPDKTIQT